MYAVTGATGQLGRKVVKSLSKLATADQIVALVRDPAKAKDLGVAARAADYNHPETLDGALQGVGTLLLISSSSMETRQQEHANVIAAAKRAGIKRFVYTSLLHAEKWSHWFAADHTRTEAWIKESGLNYTILRNGWYWENHTVAIPPSLAHGAMIGSAGSGLVSWASRQDFADAAAVVMTSPGHEGHTHELAGDKPYRLADIAAEVSRQTGKPFAYHDLGEAQHAAALEQVGLPRAFADMVAQVEAQGISTGVLHDDSGILGKLIGRPTTTLAEAISTALASLPVA
ncbi:MAG TPA: SDR family oxidoreductase [Rhizobium sp.]|nr:SDR family oxidoreductase [Rhizobium sp.]